MTPQELEAMIADVAQFLTDLDAVLPNKVDEDLIAFLNGIKNNQWLLTLLLNSITNSKQLATVRRR